MGFLSTIGTMLPTLGTILGSLLTGVKATAGNSAVVPYRFGDGIICGFKRDDAGKIWFTNSSMDDGKMVTFAVPAIGDQAAETILVSSENKVDVTEIFHECASSDSTTCMISGSAVDAARAHAAGMQNAFHYAAGGRNVPVDGVTTSRIGSFLSVVCHADRAVFTSKKTIIQITSVNFYGCNDSEVTLTAIPAAASGTGSRVEVLFPTPFAKGAYLTIDVEVDMSDSVSILAEQNRMLVPMEKEELHTMRAAALALGKRG